MVFLEKSFTFQEFLVELVGRALQLQNYKKLVIQVGINEELNRERYFSSGNFHIPKEQLCLTE